jgi:hypothetical protein
MTLWRRTRDMQVTKVGHTALVPSITEHQLSITATVPGEIVTDLQRAGVVGDPLRGRNYANASVWGGRSWSYSTSMSLPVVPFADADTTTLVVFDGIKMGARVVINGVNVGNATNQHRRYIFQAPPPPPGKPLSVAVEFDDTITTEGRFMDCSGVRLGHECTCAHACTLSKTLQHIFSCVGACSERRCELCAFPEHVPWRRVCEHHQFISISATCGLRLYF